MHSVVAELSETRTFINYPKMLIVWLLRTAYCKAINKVLGVSLFCIYGS